MWCRRKIETSLSTSQEHFSVLSLTKIETSSAAYFPVSSASQEHFLVISHILFLFDTLGTHWWMSLESWRFRVNVSIYFSLSVPFLLKQYRYYRQTPSSFLLELLKKMLRPSSSLQGLKILFSWWLMYSYQLICFKYIFFLKSRIMLVTRIIIFTQGHQGVYISDSTSPSP